MKTPAYERFWSSTGTLDVLPTAAQIVKQLESSRKAEVKLHGRYVDPTDKSEWSYDAVWLTLDGARVRARLTLLPAREESPGRPASPESTHLFAVCAEADRDWNPSWPSPLAMFVPRNLRPGYVNVEFGRRNLLMANPERLADLCAALVDLPFLAVVLTHDEQSTGKLMQNEDPVDLPLITRLPGSFYGRVVDVRIVGDPFRIAVNKRLSKYGVQLPRGGAAILLDAKRRRNLKRSDLEFPLSPTFLDGGDLGPLVDSLSKRLTQGILEADPRGKVDLGKTWELLLDSEKQEQSEERLDKVQKALSARERDVRDLLERLAAEKRATKSLKEENGELRQTLDQSIRSRGDLASSWEQAQDELGELWKTLEGSEAGRRLAEAIEARREAEDFSEIADALLDEQHQELTQVRRENQRLRRALVRFGDTSSEEGPADEPETEPSSWAELFTEAEKLKYVQLGEVQDSVTKLTKHTSAQVWMRRTWKALLALEGYARLKEEHGAGQFPHFRSYLASPVAEQVISAASYSSSESTAVVMNARLRKERYFPVPKELDETGYLLMGEHLRIGSGRPPAPRMHFYDDTSGPTGRIHVGYIGPHLKNHQTN